MTSSPLRFLILETSGRVGRVAVAEGHRLLAEQKLDETRRHARDLAPTVHSLLQAQTWQPRDVTAVLVSLGPGSYTGLRVGVMSAKAWAYATGCGLLGIQSFQAIAHGVLAAIQDSESEAGVEVIADAQQGKVYCQRFRRSPTGPWPDAASKLTIRPAAEWLAELPAGILVAGPGLRLHAEAAQQRGKIVAEQLWDPQPRDLLALGLARWQRGEGDEVLALEPLYARRSSAEENWAKRT
jgi:tRNA threonylcarbamoyladenosine biosynthesis protein TsaB